MPEEKQKFKKNVLIGKVRSGSVDIEARTFDIVFGSEAPYRRWSWGKGFYNEILSFTPGDVDMTRLQSGNAPFLDNHQSWGSVITQLGVVEKAWIENNQGHATIRFSKKKSVAEIWDDIVDGIVKNISVGYDVKSYDHVVVEGGLDEYTARDWEPYELSPVLISADRNAYIKSNSDNAPSDEAFNFVIVNKKNSMSKNVDPAKNPDTEPQKVKAVEPAPNPAPAVESGSSALTAKEVEEIAKKAVEETRKSESERVSAIKVACKAAGMTPDFQLKMISEQTDINTVRELILKEMALDESPNIRAIDATLTGASDVEKTRSGIEDAILFRSSVLTDDKGKLVTKPEGLTRQYSSLSMVEIAKKCLSLAGVNTDMMGKAEVLQRSMSTGDFPIILGNTLNRSLAAAYRMVPQTWRVFCQQNNAVDFREKSTIRLSEISAGLKKIAELGEYPKATVGESVEKWSIAKYGQTIGYSWEMMVNDDLSVFNRLPMALTAEMGLLQNEMVYGILRNNPTMGNGTALFHSSNKNLATVAAGITDASLEAAVKAFRTQKGKNGRNFINNTPSYLVVGPNKEAEALKMMSRIVANEVGQQNIYAGRYQVILDPQITDNAWFLIAQPGAMDTIHYGFLDQEEYSLTRSEDTNIDAIKWKLRHHFGAKAIEPKSMYKNPGA